MGQTGAALGQAQQGAAGWKKPGANPLDEYLIYQTLVGAWPFEFLAPDKITGSSAAAFLERMKAYLVKALREAKQETSWLDPDADYEQACLGFLEGLLDRRRSREFIADLTGFLTEIAPLGAMNALAQTVLKLTAPGVADIYQGTELWDLSLVDPDNRRPVDFAARRKMLSDAMAASSLEVPGAAQGLGGIAAKLAGWPDQAPCHRRLARAEAPLSLALCRGQL